MRDHETHLIIAAAMEVHRRLGHGFLEAVYQQALALELAGRRLPLGREVDLPVYYKGQLLSCAYRTDFLCFERVFVERKALHRLVAAHHAQMINELKATGFSIGLLLNFGAPSLEYRRFVRSQTKDLSADFADSRRLGEDTGNYRLREDTGGCRIFSD